MSTPQQSTKAPGRSNRKPKSTAMSNAPPSRGTVSDTEFSQAQLETKGNQVNDDGRSQRRKSHASTKKPNGGTHRGSISDNPQPEKSRGTPIKQAYAGPTFHQSPAASALPLPSFYSKSVPSASPVKPPPDPIHEDKKEESIDSSTGEVLQKKRETTPLDFLFDAARQARDTPRGQSPSARSGHMSVRTGSPASKSPVPKDAESMFPFELDGASTPGEDGSSFATPYRDRMEALRVSRPASEGAPSLDENERKAKTDALKNFLLKNAASHQPTNAEYNNPFNARPPQPPNGLAPPRSQIRHRSGPSTPSYVQTYNAHGRTDQYFPQPPQLPTHDPYAHAHAAHRITSNLRNVYGAASEPEPAELSSDSAVSPPRISTARNQSQTISPPSTSSGHPIAAPIRDPISTQKPSVQQMEDDLRRVLKLDLTSQG